MATIFVNSQGQARLTDPRTQEGIDRVSKRIAADKAARLSAYNTAQPPTPPSPPATAATPATPTPPANTGGSFLQRVQAMPGKANQALGRTVTGSLGRTVGVIGAVNGLADMANNGTTARNTVETGLGTAAVFIPQARPLALGSAIANAVPDSWYEKGLKAVGLWPKETIMLTEEGARHGANYYRNHPEVPARLPDNYAWLANEAPLVAKAAPSIAQPATTAPQQQQADTTAPQQQQAATTAPQQQQAATPAPQQQQASKPVAQRSVTANQVFNGNAPLEPGQGLMMNNQTGRKVAFGGLPVKGAQQAADTGRWVEVPVAYAEKPQAPSKQIEPVEVPTMGGGGLMEALAGLQAGMAKAGAQIAKNRATTANHKIAATDRQQSLQERAQAANERHQAVQDSNAQQTNRREGQRDALTQEYLSLDDNDPKTAARRRKLEAVLGVKAERQEKPYSFQVVPGQVDANGNKTLPYIARLNNVTGETEIQQIPEQTTNSTYKNGDRVVYQGKEYTYQNGRLVE